MQKYPHITNNMLVFVTAIDLSINVLISFGKCSTLVTLSNK